MKVPVVGNYYKLSWSANPEIRYKLLSWDNSGNCIMRSPRGKEFTTHLNHLK